MNRLLLIGVMGTLVAAGLPLAAQDTAAAPDTSIVLAGQTVMRIRTGAGGMTAEQRAQTIQDRLTPIVSLPHLTPQDVTVTQTRPKQDASILVRGHLLITVDQTLAHANGDTPGHLAQVWAANLRTALPQAQAIVGPQSKQGYL